MNPPGNHEVACLIPGLCQWVKDPMLLWLWHRQATVALIQPLAWELSYVSCVALKSQKKKGQMILGLNEEEKLTDNLVYQITSIFLGAAL